MHGREKSDSAILAMKPANKAGQPAAERVEQRAEAEGNMVEPRTRRTPSRESVPQGLDRVRQAAKVRKRERFTALLHHVNVDLLRDAYFWLKRNAAPGIDGVTWQAYAQDLEAKLVDLHARIHRGAYRAAQVHREAGRTATSARHRRARRQDRPACAGGGAQCDLRGRLSW